MTDSLQRAFRQRKEGYIKKLEEQVKEFQTMEQNFRALQNENYQLREYILNLQSRLLESQSDIPPAPSHINLVSTSRSGPNNAADPSSAVEQQLRREMQDHGLANRLRIVANWTDGKTGQRKTMPIRHGLYQQMNPDSPPRSYADAMSIIHALRQEKVQNAPAWMKQHRLPHVLEVTWDHLQQELKLVSTTVTAVQPPQPVNMLKREKTKKRSIRGKQLCAGWDEAYLLRLLGI